MKKLMAGSMMAAACLCAVSRVWAVEGGDKPADKPAPAHPAMMEALSFEKMDANADGKVSLEEFLAAQAEMAKQRFKTADANGDGSLAKDELQKVRVRPRGERGLRGEGAKPAPAAPVTDKM